MDTALNEQGFQVRIRGEDPFRQDSRVLVENMVEDGQAVVAHADLIEIGKGQNHFKGYGLPILDYCVYLVAQVLAGPLDVVNKIVLKHAGFIHVLLAFQVLERIKNPIILSGRRYCISEGERSTGRMVRSMRH